MDVQSLKIQELSSFFDVVSKLRDLEIMMCRANNNEPTPNLKLFGNAYNILYRELVNRIMDLEDMPVEKIKVKAKPKKTRKKKNEEDLVTD